MSDEAELAGHYKVGYFGMFIFGDFIIDVHYLDKFRSLVFQYAAIFEYFVTFNYLQHDLVADITLQQRLERCPDRAHQLLFHLRDIFVLRSQYLTGRCGLFCLADYKVNNFHDRISDRSEHIQDFPF